MSPLNKTSISDKLFKLDEAVKIIEELLTRRDLMSDLVIKTSLYFNLVISIEIILDIGNHILAENFSRAANNYKDIITGLGDRGVISKEFAKENAEMGDFRNKLIHDYDRINDEQAHEYAKKAPEIFRAFGKYFLEFIGKTSQ